MVVICIFREPCTREQKAIAKITLSNSDKQSVVYASTLSMIKLLAIDKTFDQYALNEFERLNIIAHLFSNNFFSKNIKHQLSKQRLQTPISIFRQAW